MPRRRSNGGTLLSQPAPYPDEVQALEITRISKSFGRYPALHEVSLAASDREFVALLGPSGSGKTTLLRVLAGLEQPDAGEVRFGGEDFLALPARRRRVGMVFQHYALFRHMTVAQNIAFGLTVRGWNRPAKAEIGRRVADLIALVQLDGLGGRYPAQLSGGQRQRVALARALAIEPRMLLLDEPFGALDAQVRRDLRHWLREVHDRAGVTTVFVTHDQEEALDLADRIAILREGKLIQLGTPKELYEQPATAFAYEFLGPACRLPGFVADGRLQVGGWTTRAPDNSPSGAAELYFRPDEVVFGGPGDEGIVAQISGVATRGLDVKVECVAEGQTMELHARSIPAGTDLRPGATVRVRPMRPAVYPRDA